MKRYPYSGRISHVAGLAAEIGLQAGDELLAINDQSVRDIIDVQFYAAEPELDLLIRRDGELWLYEVERAYDEPLGLTFEHPTFDTEIRRCNNQCLFCFVSQMAPPRTASRGRFRESLYIKDDDYRYSFLDGNYVTLTNLSQDDWRRIQEQRLSPLYVSVHATELALRRKLLGNPQAPDILAQLTRLAGYGIKVHTQLVIVPELNDGVALARSIADLGSLWPTVQSISVVPVGLTRFHRKKLRVNTAAEAIQLLDSLADWQRHFMDRVHERLVYATDEWYLLAGRTVPQMVHYRQLDALRENGVGLVREFLDEWQQSKKRVVRLKHRSITLASGMLFAPILATAGAEMASVTGLSIDVQPIRNHLLGETITVAGLLMGHDVLEQLRTRPLGEMVILPAVMFRGPGGLSLDGMRLDEIAAALERPVLLAESMGDIWQVLKEAAGR